MASIVRALARRSKSNNIYKTTFFINSIQCVSNFVSRYKALFANAKAGLLLCKAQLSSI